ncbi:MAG: DNA methyltransferase [Deltaproteobacteria bacterium]|nr:DNA methyltransferase [Myxococcales bacterium]MDP3217279.1 DNA methyltransferase [Deltaproteobacteria bacterium]
MDEAYTASAAAQSDRHHEAPEGVDPYEAFIAAKRVEAPSGGFVAEAISAILFPFQRDAVGWALARGCAALFESFGLGKTFQHLELVRQVLAREGGRGLIVAPIGVRAEFMRDAATLGVPLTSVRTDAEVPESGACITHYEAVRDGKVDPRRFVVVSLDEVQCLRGGGATKMFREFMSLFEGAEAIRYRFIASATPAPNEYIELLVYAAFLGVMDIGAAKTRWFKRDSTKADNLKLHPHKEAEFWAWVASWALFITKPSDLGYSDEGYVLPPLEVHWHELPSDHARAGIERSGQARLLADPAAGIVEASRERRGSLDARVAKVLDLVRALRTNPVGEGDTPHARTGLSDQVVVWCDLNDEQDAIEAALAAEGIACSSMFGGLDIDERETRVERWKARETSVFLSKPVMYGAGVNLQQCATMVFAGVDYKFAPFIQAIHRIYRFLQLHLCRVHIVLTAAQAAIRRDLERKWRAHDELVATMTNLVRTYGLARSAMHALLGRATTVARREVVTSRCVVVNNDTVMETRCMAADSVGLICTSIPFGNQYEYCSSFYDFGHTDDPAHFFRQMDHLTPELLRVLQPGRILAVHVKDRIVPGGINGLGFQTLYPFHADCIAHYTRHGFALLGMVTIVTDVVRENNQTYRLAYTEQCKDGSRQGVGVPEYLLLFRKPQSDRSKGYADVPVVKLKEEYSLSRWQIDASGFHRSSGDRLLSADDLRGLTHAQIFKLFRRWNLSEVYDYEHHVALNRALEERGALPVDFSLLQPQSWSEHVWTDVTRMRTLNGAQAAKGRELHLCPFQFDIVDRVIRQYSNPGDVVFDPFAGIGTVPSRAVTLGRRGRGHELSERYFDDMVFYTQAAERQAAVPTLFDLDAALVTDAADAGGAPT